MDSFYPKGFQEIASTEVVHNFKEPTFIETGTATFPKLKINTVAFLISTNKVTQRVELMAEDIVGFILKNIIEGTEQTFDKTGKVRG